MALRPTSDFRRPTFKTATGKLFLFPRQIVPRSAFRVRHQTSDLRHFFGWRGAYPTYLNLPPPVTLYTRLRSNTAARYLLRP